VLGYASVHSMCLSESVLKLDYGKIFVKNWPPNLTSVILPVHQRFVVTFKRH
jgi:hypothetical protein